MSYCKVIIIVVLMEVGSGEVSDSCREQGGHRGVSGKMKGHFWV